MPHKITLYAFFLLVVFSTTNSNAQEYDCASIDESGFIRKAYQSFEKDLFNYYNFGNDSIKTYKTFLAEVTTLSIDLRKLPSDSSIQLARAFKKKATEKNSIWIKLSDYEQHEATKTTKPSASIPDNANEEEILIFNYRGGFIQCLKNTSTISEFKTLIQTLEDDGNISTSIIAQKISALQDDQVNTRQVKKFIAFDIYYSILMVIEKAFG